MPCESLFIYLEITGDSSRSLTTIQNLPMYSVSTKFLTSQLSLERGAIALTTMFVDMSLPAHTA
ncbi:hypothetical protein C460_08000 [Haloferax sp. ATCC BAA-646]|nr:hypothetical protein C460_08000 [Haloferax sp. ATCC BAA-646]ELZ60344.1 hypothetical protein C459_16541 [Haloferax sp. ATCC BAA-645]